MRVAFITHYTNLYGANRSLLNLIDGLRNYGVVPYVIAPAKGAMTDALCSRQVAVEVLPLAWWVGPQTSSDSVRSVQHVRRQLSRRVKPVCRLLTNLRILPTLTRRLRSWNIDVVYTNTGVTPIGAMAASIIGRPHVWHLREFADLDYGFAYDWGAGVSKYVIRKANAVIAISNAVRSHFTNGASAANTYVIYNGIASEAEFDRLRTLAGSLAVGGTDRPYTFCLVGFISPAKGQEEAIRALAVLKRGFSDVRLLIVGLGEIEHLKALAKELGVYENVEFWGHIDDPYEAFMASDAALMCSRHEGMGRVTAEAMAACRPVIGYNQAGTPEIIEHGRTGLLYLGGPEVLADCMRQFVVSPAWARQLGDNGWHVARRKYSVEAYARSVYEVLTLVGGFPSAPDVGHFRRGSGISGASRGC